MTRQAPDDVRADARSRRRGLHGPSLALACGWVAFACGGSQAPSQEPQAATASSARGGCPAPTPAAGEAPKEPPTTEPASPIGSETLAELPESFRFRDPFHWYGLHAQPKPARYNNLPPKLSGGVFPGQAVSEVRAFELGSQEEALHYFDESCEVLRRDGTLCPHVLYPGSLLTAEQTARLLRVVAAPKAVRVVSNAAVPHSVSRPTLRCGDAPGTAFVFYSRQGAPVGVVTLGAECQTWELLPAPQGGWEGHAALTQEELDVFQPLCEELGLSSCSASVLTTPSASASRSEQARQLLPSLLAQRPQLPLQTLKDVPAGQRPLLCTWARRATVFAGYVRYGAPGNDAELTPSGESRSLQLQGLATCLAADWSTCATSTEEAFTEVSRVLTAYSEGRVEFPRTCVFGVATVPAR